MHRRYTYTSTADNWESLQSARKIARRFPRDPRNPPLNFSMKRKNPLPAKGAQADNFRCLP
jgi:hypothetical protein